LGVRQWWSTAHRLNRKRKKGSELIWQRKNSPSLIYTRANTSPQSLRRSTWCRDCPETLQTKQRVAPWSLCRRTDGMLERVELEAALRPHSFPSGWFRPELINVIRRSGFIPGRKLIYSW
jgi:hypothetical protein